MLRHVLVLVAAFALCVPPVRAADAPAAGEKPKLESKDQKFITGAARGGEMEVALGKLAAEKGASDDVKKFGQQMVDDHSKANTELATLAESKGVDVSKAKENATKAIEKQSDKLGKMTGAEFDKAYVKLMVKDHEKDVKEFEEASKSAADADLKAWAAKTLPTLQHHLEMIKEIDGKLGK
jgi:putative membrane protein